MRQFAMISVTAALLAGCASKVEVVAPPPVVATLPVVAPPMPKGAFPGMKIPVMFADGTYPTPNRGLTQAATVWHLRAALNVAALACRGADEATIVAGYNALLAAQKPVLAKAEATYAAEYRSAGGDWQDRYDDSMTRLYNFFSQSPARDAFCQAAGRVLAEGATVQGDALASFAATRLPLLEQPFTDFYRAFDAWRGNATRPLAARRIVFASNQPVAVGPARVVPVAAGVPAVGVVPAARAVTPAAPLPATPGATPAAYAAPGLQTRLKPVSQPPVPAAATRPRLQLDPSVFQ